MIASIIAITNAALMSWWATGVGVVKVEYDLNPDGIVVTNRETVAFTDDESTGERVMSAYASSGYDRGHLAPAADFAGQPMSRLGKTYLSSNISPMIPKFNRGVWAKVEKELRETARRVGTTVHVVTIPVYGGTNKLGSVSIPTAFLKLAQTNGITIAVWYESQE